MENEDCARNYKTSSSKAIESTTTLKLIVTFNEQGISVEYIVSDDDSVMQAHLSHIGHEKDKLPLNALEPTLLCDPSRCIKSMVKDIFTLALSSKTKVNVRTLTF